MVTIRKIEMPEQELERVKAELGSAESLISTLEAQRDELMAACKELREASAACLRVFSAWQQLAKLGIYDPIKELENELKDIGLTDGWGVRAQAAISNAQDSFSGTKGSCFPDSNHSRGSQ